MAETTYKHCKKLIKKKEDKTNQPIKIKVSLSRGRQKLLEYASKVTYDCSLIHFVYTDINGNLKVRVREPSKTGWFLASIAKWNWQKFLA